MHQSSLHLSPQSTIVLLHAGLSASSPPVLHPTQCVAVLVLMEFPHPPSKAGNMQVPQTMESVFQLECHWRSRSHQFFVHAAFVALGSPVMAWLQSECQHDITVSSTNAPAKRSLSAIRLMLNNLLLSISYFPHCRFHLTLRSGVRPCSCNPSKHC